MSQVREDPARPGFVDVPSLLASCAQSAKLPWKWNVTDVDMIVSSKPDNLYPNSCAGPGGSRPRGFMPGSHAATAEFFALYYQHCMPPTSLGRAYMEVANECNVKTGAGACNSSWGEMVALHAAVGDGVHAAHAAAAAKDPSALRPLVCGPTAAFPEYQLHDFQMWRAGGTFDAFLAGTNGSIDCLSVHLYSTYGGVGGYADDDNPWSENFTTHEGGNLLATLDLQEAATAAARGGGGGGSGGGGGGASARPLPLLVSEYGAGFHFQPTRYRPAHDFWMLRAVNSMLMTMLERPDRIAKALPFICNKATWDKPGLADNATEPYPFVLWRNVTAPNGTVEWLPTHLHKHYAAWRDVDGERFAAASGDSNVQVHAFRAGSNWTVVVNNLNLTAGARVSLSWAATAMPPNASIASVMVRRLSWDAALGEPVLADTVLPLQSTAQSPALPAALALAPAELAFVVVSVRARSQSQLAPRASVDLRTLHSARVLSPLPASQAAAAAAPHAYTLPSGAVPRRVRVGIGGADHHREAALAALRITVNGVRCHVDPGRQIAGKLHYQPKDDSFLTAIEVAVPAAAAAAAAAAVAQAESCEVQVWSDVANATGIVVSTVSLVTATHQ